jgi:hypothetical protein
LLAFCSRQKAIIKIQTANIICLFFGFSIAEIQANFKKNRQISIIFSPLGSQNIKNLLSKKLLSNVAKFDKKFMGIITSYKTTKITCFWRFSIPRNQPKFKKDRQFSIHGFHWVAKNIEGYFSPKKLLSYLACSQIWRNLLVDHHQFGYKHNKIDKNIHCPGTSIKVLGSNPAECS